MTKRLIMLPEVVGKIGLNKSSIYARVKRGDFPAPIKVGARTTWLESEIDSWIDSQVAAAREKAA